MMIHAVLQMLKEEPVLFTAKLKKQPIICYLTDEVENVCIYLCNNIDQTIFDKMVEDEISVREVFNKPFLLKVHYAEDKEESSEKIIDIDPGYPLSEALYPKEGLLLSQIYNHPKPVHNWQMVY